MLHESQLAELCHALGWQGGTYHQVLAEVRQLATVRANTHDTHALMAEVGLVGYGEETGTYTIPVPAMLNRIARLVALARIAGRPFGRNAEPYRVSDAQRAMLTSDWVTAYRVD